MKKNNSQKNKNTIGFGLIYVILLGVFNLLVFTIFKNHTMLLTLYAKSIRFIRHCYDLNDSFLKIFCK